MKKLILFFTMLCLCISLGNTQTNSRKKLFNESFHNISSRSAFLYTLTTFNDTYTELTGATSLNNGEVWDEPDYVLPIPFNFKLNGNPISSLQFIAGGSLLVGETSDPDIQTLVFAFETDLIDRGAFNDISISPISYKTTGASPNRILKLEFKNAGSYNEMDALGTLDMFVNFQMWLYEGSNKIEFRYGSSSIPDPDNFYGGDPGAVIGVTDANFDLEIFYGPHFITGSAGNPALSEDPNVISGTPANGMVYQLSLGIPLSITLSGVNSNSFCAPNGSAIVQVSGGEPPYAYLWNNGGTTSTINNLSAGSYTVTVTDNIGSTISGSILVISPVQGPINVNAESTDETAVNANNGTAIAQPEGGLPPYQWLWSNGSAAFMIHDLAPGEYTVTITDDAGCTATQTVVVNEFGCPDLSLDVTIQNVSCFGLCDGSINVNNVIGGSGPFVYQWSSGSATAGITNLCPGDFSVTVIDIDGCQVITQFTITEPSLLNANAGATNETFLGLHDGTATASATGGTLPYTYLWSEGSTQSSIQNLAPGIYTVTIGDAQGCTSSQTVMIEAGTCGAIHADIINVSCFEDCNGSIEVTFQNATLPITYLWENGTTTATLSDLCAGEYSVTATDALGCIKSGTFSVSSPGPIFTHIQSIDETASGANDGSAWVVPSGGVLPYTYGWSNGSTDSLITSLAPDIFYDVTITDANGCSTTDDIFIESFPCFEFLDVLKNHLVCDDDCSWTITPFLFGGIGPIEFEWSTGDTTDAIEGVCPGLYTLKATDLGQNCFSIVTFQIEPSETIEAQVDEIVNLTDSTTTEINITVSSGTGPFFYSWYNSNGIISNDEDLSNIPPGIYYVIIEGQSGCTRLDSIEVLDLTVGITNPWKDEVSIYPNPARDRLFINVENTPAYELQLLDPEGRMIYSGKNETEIDLEAFNAGIYFLKISSGEKYFTKRLLIFR